MIYQLGEGGWVTFITPSVAGAIRVRFAMGESGRLEPAEMHLEGHPTVTSSLLRKYSISHLESFANGHNRQELVARVEATGKKVERTTDRWLDSIGGHFEIRLSEELIKRVRRSALRLNVPNDLKKPDKFYKHVADLYMALTDSGSRRPAQEIADANENLEVTTVHRWIKEARRRGVLGSGRRGKAG